MYLAIDTRNEKLVGKPRRGICAAITLPIKQTCGPCAVKDECYAKFGPVSWNEQKIEEASEGLSPEEISTLAAEEMIAAADEYYAEGRPLRLFVAGDARTPEAAGIMAEASRYWRRRGGTDADGKPIAVWGYTHAWRRVPREVWYGVSMFASVETPRAAQEAIEAGYTPALIVGEFPNSGEPFERGGVTWIPCPAQVTDGRVPCVRCRLCFDDGARYAEGRGIAFMAHGTKEKTTSLKRRLTVMRDPQAPSGAPEPCFAPTAMCQSLQWLARRPRARTRATPRCAPPPTPLVRDARRRGR